MNLRALSEFEPSLERNLYKYMEGRTGSEIMRQPVGISDTNKNSWEKHRKK
jgi:hypothetical protein